MLGYVTCPVPGAMSPSQRMGKTQMPTCRDSTFPPLPPFIFLVRFHPKPGLLSGTALIKQMVEEVYLRLTLTMTMTMGRCRTGVDDGQKRRLHSSVPPPDNPLYTRTQILSFFRFTLLILTDSHLKKGWMALFIGNNIVDLQLWE